MADYARVVIEKDALVNFQESLNIGKQVLERKLLAYKDRLKRFEETKGMDTPTFTRLFQQGELGDNKEWIAWDHVASAANLLSKKLQDIQNSFKQGNYTAYVVFGRGLNV